MTLFLPMLDFVIASTGRSGSGWISQVLTRAGLECGHETVFNIQGVNQGAVHLAGDSSWIVVRDILAGTLPDHVRVYHQVRHPLNVINSLAGTNFLRPKDPSPYGRLRRQLLPCAPIDYVETAMECYWYWNKWIERRAQIRWSIEYFTPQNLVTLAKCEGVDVSLKTAKKIIDSVPPTHNKHKTASLSWDDLPGSFLKEKLYAMAVMYGYDPRHPPKRDDSD